MNNQNPFGAGGFQSPDDFFKGMMNPYENSGQGSGGGSGPDPLAQAKAKARAMGYNTERGDYAFKVAPKTGAGGGYPIRSPYSNFMSSGGSTGGGNQGPDLGLLMSGLQFDTSRLQQAADEQWLRNNAVNQGFASWLGQAPGALANQGAVNQGIMENQAKWLDEWGGHQVEGMQDWIEPIWKQAQGVGKDVLKGAANVTKGLANVDADLENAYRSAQGAVDTMQMTIHQYEDRTAQDAATISSGIQEQAMAQMKMAETGLGPNGELLTAAQRADMKQRTQFDTMKQVSDQVTQVFSRFNETKAQLGQALAGLKMQQGGVYLQGADIRQKNAGYQLQAQQLALQAGQYMSGVGVQLGGLLQDAYAKQLQAADISSNLRKAGAEFMSAGLLSAANLTLGGYTAYADMIRQNPKSVVTVFEGLLSMFSLGNAQAAARGAGGGGGFGGSGNVKDVKDHAQGIGGGGAFVGGNGGWAQGGNAWSNTNPWSATGAQGVLANAQKAYNGVPI